MAGITIDSIDELTEGKFSLDQFLNKVMGSKLKKFFFRLMCNFFGVTSSRPLLEWMNMFSFGLNYQKK